MVGPKAVQGPAGSEMSANASSILFVVLAVSLIPLLVSTPNALTMALKRLILSSTFAPCA